MAKLVCVITCWLFTATAWAQQSINVAVTSSFKPVLEQLAEMFEQQSGIELRLSSASTGVLFQQIISGAPYELFFSADAQRAAAIQQAFKLPESAIATYAIGQLVMVSSDENITQLIHLQDYSGRVIIANPSHAPYGVAAQTVLASLNVTGPRVLANNVSQATQYLSLKLASVGFISASFASGFSGVLPVPVELHAPIEQKRVTLKPSANTETLLTFLQSAQAQRIIKNNGYLLAEID